MKKLIFFVSIILLFSCKNVLVENIVNVKTMGTSGTIKYISSNKIDFQKQIDSLLLDVNMSLSTYIDSSTISKVNKKYINTTFAYENDKHFAINFDISSEVWNKTNHFFNPGIMPLIQYWKVQNKEKESYNLKVDSLHIDSLVKFVNNDDIWKQIDFSAIAKGYGVDVVAEFLEKKGIENYMVEIGGEVHCKGKNIEDEFWKIGIEEPNEEERKLYAIVSLENKSMATSGNYRNFKILDSGQKIVHIINPKTGYPEISNLLSASIITDKCSVADAYATACMVMGVDTCFDFIISEPTLECYLIYSDENGNLKTKISDGFNSYLNK